MQAYSRIKFVLLAVPLFFCCALAFLLVNDSGLRCSNFHVYSEDKHLSEEYPQGLGGFRFVKYLEDDSWRPAYFISFDGFMPKHCLLGLFRTPLKKVAIVKNLKLQLYEYSKGISNQQEESVINSSLAAATILDNLTECLRSLKSKGRDFSLAMDTSAISAVEVEDLTYEVYRDDQLALSIQCKLATLSGRQSTIQLNGHAVIKSSVNTLESNSIAWDMEKRLFVAKGYCLALNNRKTMGPAITVDYELNQVSTDYKEKDLEAAL